MSFHEVLGIEDESEVHDFKIKLGAKFFSIIKVFASVDRVV